MNLTLETLNKLPADDAMGAFRLCCTSSRWVSRMVADRPYADLEAIQASARAQWQHLDEADYLEAFAGHPKIGDINSLREKYAASKALASGEQSSVTLADEQTLLRLAQANERYETNNGFIFIVCASGKSAAEMLTLLEARLSNTRAQELEIAAAEQAKITALRLAKLIQPER